MIGLILLMAIFIHVCAVHTPTSNPNIDKGYVAKSQSDQISALHEKKRDLIVSKALCAYCAHCA